MKRSKQHFSSTDKLYAMLRLVVVALYVLSLLSSNADSYITDSSLKFSSKSCPYMHGATKSVLERYHPNTHTLKTSRDTLALYFKPSSDRNDGDDEDRTKDATEYASDLKFLFQVLTNGLHKTFTTARKVIRRMQRITTEHFIIADKSDHIRKTAFLATSSILHEREERILHIIHDLTKIMVKAGSTPPFENMDVYEDMDDDLYSRPLASEEETLSSVHVLPRGDVVADDAVADVNITSHARTMPTKPGGVLTTEEAKKIVERRIQEIKGKVPKGGFDVSTVFISKRPSGPPAYNYVPPRLIPDPATTPFPIYKDDSASSISAGGDPTAVMPSVNIQDVIGKRNMISCGMPSMMYFLLQM